MTEVVVASSVSAFASSWTNVAAFIKCSASLIEKKLFQQKLRLQLQLLLLLFLLPCLQFLLLLLLLLLLLF